MTTASIRRVPTTVHAARQPTGAEHGVGATLVLGAQLQLTVLDAHTQRPVSGARVQRIDVENCEDASFHADRFADLAFDLPFPPPPWAPSFGDAQESRLEALLAEVDQARRELDDKAAQVRDALDRSEGKGREFIENDDSSPEVHEKFRSEYAEILAELKQHTQAARELEAVLARLLAERDQLLAKRQERRAWVAYLQSSLIALGQYDGAADGVMTPAFSSTLATAYSKLTGKTYSLANASHRSVARTLYDLLARRHATDENGVLSVPLPPGVTGTVTVEFAHLKVIDPVRQGEFGNPAAGPMRCDYDLTVAESADLPGSTEKESGWRLVQGDVVVPFQNFIEVPFDTTDLLGVCRAPIEARTFALVWCQPTWLPVQDDQYVLEPGNASLIRNGRGLQDDQPTLLLSTSKSARGRWYGAWGKDGRVYGAAHLDRHVKKLHDRFYLFEARRPTEVEAEAATAADAEAWIREHYPKLADRLCRKVVPVAEWLHAAVRAADGASDETGAAYYVVGHRTYKEFETRDEARAEASRAAGASRGRSFIQKDGDQWFVHRLGEAANQNLHAGPFKTFDQALVEFTKKMHHGVDLAGNPGDRVFAVCGGVTKQREQVDQSGKLTGAGRFVNVGPWIREPIAKMQFFHLEEYRGEDGATAKAGDVIGLMGRTGNPTQDSPTHVHFQARDAKGRDLDLSECVVHGQRAVLPHNALPKLLPCAADFGEHNDDRQGPRHCRAKFPDNHANTIPTGPTADGRAGCWAMTEGVCPFAEQYRESLRRPPRVRSTGRYRHTLDESLLFERELRARHPDYGRADGFEGHGWNRNATDHPDVWVCTSYVAEVLRRSGYDLGAAGRSVVNIVLSEHRGIAADVLREHPTWSRAKRKEEVGRRKKAVVQELLRARDPRLKGVVHALVTRGFGTEVTEASQLQPGDCLQWWQGTGGHCVLVKEVLDGGKKVKQHGCHLRTHGVGDWTIPLSAVKWYAVRPIGNANGSGTDGS